MIFYFESPWKKNRKRDFFCLRLHDARDKPLIDVSSARGLNEPRLGALVSSRTGGEQTQADSPPLGPPLTFSISFSVSLYTSSIHMSLLDTDLSQSAPASSDRSILPMSSPLWSHWKLDSQ